MINDSLGIAAELETDMQALVGAYACEWKAAIENPDMRKRFTHFVNAPADKDPSVVFEPMREQRRAAEWK